MGNIRKIVVCSVICLLVGNLAVAKNDSQKWTQEKSWEWYNSLGEIKGGNYLPQYANNSTDMWQDESFDLEIIERELSWIHDAGLNNIRVPMQFVVWQSDPKGTVKKMKTFADIAQKNSLKITWVLFDDKHSSIYPTTDPKLGNQGEPLPGEFNPYRTPCPGLEVLANQDPKVWKQLEKYVKTVVSAFKTDERVLMWDLYNEPGTSYSNRIATYETQHINNEDLKSGVSKLSTSAYAWAREAGATQPLTMSLSSHESLAGLNQELNGLSDVISIKSYDNLASVKEQIAQAREIGRPVFMTEFLTRKQGNDFDNLLPVFAKNKIGWFTGGLIQGKSQLWFKPGSKAGTPIPKVWERDILVASGTPYSFSEIDLIKNFRFYEKYKVVMPTSEDEAQDWNYIMDVPNWGWHLDLADFDYKAFFQGATWSKGCAPFSSDEEIAGTFWDNNNIWIRKTINLKQKPLNPYLLIKHDKEVEVYINGECAYKSEDYSDEYELVPFFWRGRASIRKGENIIAVHCHKGKHDRGDQYLDLGIVDIKFAGEPVPKELGVEDLILDTNIDVGEVWSAEKAWKWYNEKGEIAGCNFLPSSAQNSVEMWERDTFDPETIDKELGWAQVCGYNSVRVYLNYKVWEKEGKDYLDTFDQFLGLADKHGITVMPIFFDDCCFAMKMEPYYGEQDDPIPGATNSGWVPSPGYSMSVDVTTYPLLEAFVKGFVNKFANDERVLMWDIYNEPGPGFVSLTSSVLTKYGMKWARECHPVQPVTAAPFANPKSMEYILISDVVTFHDYGGAASLENYYKTIWEQTKKPAIVTECMIHGSAAELELILPLLEKYHIGFYNWGFVAGRIQTYNHFGQARCTVMPEPWLCDILWIDGKPYNEKSIEAVKKFRYKEFPVDELK